MTTHGAQSVQYPSYFFSSRHFLQREWLIPNSSITTANISIPRAETPIGSAPLSFVTIAATVARAAITAVIQGTFLIILPLLSDIADVLRDIPVAWMIHPKYGVK